MYKGSTYKRCGCKGPKVGEDGTPKLAELGKTCPDLGKRSHGTWYYYVELPPGIGGKRQRPRKGGFPTQKAAAEAAQKLWDEAHAGVNVLSGETVEQYLRRWLAGHQAARSTLVGYRAYVEQRWVPALGSLRMRDLRTAHLQAMFDQIQKDNEVHAENRARLAEAREEERAAHERWKNAAKPRPPELRAAWDAAKADVKAAYALPRNVTGPSTLSRMLTVLHGALQDAVDRDKLLTENWARHVKIPAARKPKPLLWTPERVKSWRESGRRPGPVMVWTPEQAGEFLDRSMGHRLYVPWHLMAFRGLRRGEVCGLRWAEVDLEAGTAHISEQLVSASYEVWENAPKGGGERTVTLDSQTADLIRAWRVRREAEQEEWFRKGAGEAYHRTGLVFGWENGAAYHPDYLSSAFKRQVAKLGMPPIRLHDLRHLAATLSLAAGVHMKVVQELLGHASYTLTADTYTSVLPQIQRAAAEATVAMVPRAGVPSPRPAPDGDGAVVPGDTAGDGAAGPS